MNELTLARYAESFLRPLALAVDDQAEEALLLERLGYSPPPGVSFLAGLKSTVNVVTGATQALAGGDPDVAKLVSDILDAVQSLSNIVTTLQGSLSGSAAGSSLITDTDFLTTLPRTLFDLLLIDFLAREAPGTLGALRVLSIVRLQAIEVSNDPNRVSHVSAVVAWEQLPKLVSDPLEELKQYYGWGTPAGIDVPVLFESVRILATAVGLRSEYRGIAPAARQMINQSLGTSGRVQETGDPISLRLPILPIPHSMIGVDIYPVDENAGVVSGLALDAFADAQATITAQLTQNLRFDVHLGGYISGFGLLLRPDQPVAVITSVSSADPAAVLANVAVEADLAVTYESSKGRPLVLLGTERSTRLQMDSLAAKVAVEKEQQSTDIDFRIEAALTRAAVVIQGGTGDGFLAKVLPKDGVKLEFDFLLGYSLRSGIYFGASGGFELAVPLNITLLDVLTIQTAYLSLRAGTSNGKTKVLFAASALIKLNIGPLTASVEKLGVQAQLKSAETAGNLGPMDFGIAFKPPNGIGLKIAAEAVTGGGYLFFDFDEESYAGVAQLKIQDFLDIKLIGLLTTRLPELPPGEKGFSLLLIVAAEFSPITLAFGFTLNGVGGLIGINRTMMLEPLRAGVKNRTLDSILFPQDPVGRATQIISDLKSVFPPALNRFVLGPMVKIGWGSPSLLTLEIGIIIEIPMPIRIALLGTLTLELPNPKVPLVVIHMDILGTIDIARCAVSIDATLYDSRILAFTLTGDMAMRLNWGESPEFILSIGGFHPKFQPPPGFPSLGRMALSLATGENPRVRLETYIAVTSNTFQMGAKVDLFASVDLFLIGTLTASAYLGFDTLFQFDPFHFIAELYGGADIRRNGASLISAELRLTLEGPGPFTAVGIAAINFLGRHEITVQATMGAAQSPEPLPTSQPLALLHAALADIRNWSVLLPARQAVPVVLREQDPAGACPLHPFGGVKTRQTVVPLNTAIERFGNTAPDYRGPFVIEEVALKGSSKVVANPASFVKERFAPAQYFAIPDEEKISRPSFEVRDAGMELTWEQFESGDAFDTGPGIDAVWEYDTVEVDVQERTRSTTTEAVQPALANRWLSGSASRQSRLDEKGSARYVGEPLKMSVADTSYVVIDTTTGNITPIVNSSGGNYTDAKAASAGAPGAKVVGQHEVSANV